MKKILMLGGALSQIPAIKRAKQLGYYVITCDYLPDNPGHQYADEYVNVSTVELDKVLEVAIEKKIDGIIAYASDPAAQTAAYVAEKMGLPGGGFQSVKMLSEKDSFRAFMKNNGFFTPWFFSIKDEDELTTVVENVKFPCMVKPVDSSGSKGVCKVKNMQELKAAVREAIDRSRAGRAIIEEYIHTPYCQIHGDGIVIDGKLEFVALGDQRFRHNVPIGTALPSTIDHTLMEKAVDTVSHMIECSGLKFGGVNIEIRVTAAGEISVVEIGPRAGGNYVPQLVQESTGVDEVTILLKLAMGDKIPKIFSHAQEPVYQCVIGSSESGIFSGVEMDQLAKNNTKQLFLHKKKGDQVQGYENSNGVVGVAIMHFTDVDIMEDTIQHISDHVKVNLI